MNFAPSRLLVKNKATETPHGVYYMQPSLALVYYSANVGILYIHIRGAFSVARFDKKGNAKAYRSWNE
ncbi:MAG: hypothetical protein SPE04_00910 [Prevotella sp.]|nr:hypothetical protein [Prevotella sp.]OYP61005.1 hypothetical protein CIK98_15995 [Prevotella sp. P2-180]